MNKEIINRISIHIEWQSNFSFNDFEKCIEKVNLGINDFFRNELNVSNYKIANNSPIIEKVKEGSIELILGFVLSIPAGVIANYIFARLSNAKIVNDNFIKIKEGKYECIDKNGEKYKVVIKKIE